MKPKYITIAVVVMSLLCILLLIRELNSEPSRQYSLTPEGVLANMANDTALLIKCTTPDGHQIYTFAENVLLIDALNIGSWNISDITSLNDIEVVIRIAEGYEIAIDEDGKVLIFDEYTSNGSTEAYYESDLAVRELIEYIQQNSEKCDSPWGAFVN